MPDLYLFLKGLHIIGFVGWFAGLFYLVRVFVYHAEAANLPDQERHILQKQYGLMQQRVYRIICNPAMMITWTAGIAMLIINGLEWLGTNSWMHTKLLLLVLLLVYHLYCKGIIKKLKNGKEPMDAFRFRLFNEVPTLLLVTIVLLAVYRNTINYFYLFGGLIAFAALMFLGAKIYKKRREKG